MKFASDLDGLHPAVQRRISVVERWAQRFPIYGADSVVLALLLAGADERGVALVPLDELAKCSRRSPATVRKSIERLRFGSVIFMRRGGGLGRTSVYQVNYALFGEGPQEVVI